MKTNLTKNLKWEFSMNIYQTYACLVIGIIVLGIIVNSITTIVKRKKLISNIKQLWKSKKTLEEFIRPNSRFDYQFNLRRKNYSDTLIDDKTWTDLDMDTLFHKSNFNFTAIGEMKWYATLRKMFTINNKKLVNQFKDEQFRVNVSYHLALIGKVVYPLFPDQIKPVKRNNLFMLCSFLPLLGAIIIFINISLGILVILFSILLNIGLSAYLKKSYSQDLKSIFYTSKVIKHSYSLSKIKGTPSINIDFQQFKLARSLSGFIGKADDQDIGGTFIMLFKMSFMLDYFFFHIIQFTYVKHQEELLQCYDYISTLDNHYSLVMYRRTLHTYCEPSIIKDKQQITFSNLLHPLLTEAVPNSLNIKHNILLTGSNASGKSTFMKAVATNLILAQTLNTATAEAFSYKPGLVYTSMANTDDILSGDSYFMTELKSIRRLFNIKNNQLVYCFIDEIFKGTNTTERIAASESVLNYLDTEKHYKVIAATHDIELSEYLKANYENYHFNESIENNQIYFDYKIKKGKANTRNAIELLRITQFPERVYTRAKQTIE